MLIIITQAHPKSNPQIQEFFRHPSLPPNPTISQPPSAPFSPSPPPHTPHQNAPLFAAVESDVVGYSTIEVPFGYSIIALPFESLDENVDSQGGMPIQSITGNLNHSSSRPSLADQILVQDPISKGYVMYTYKDSGWVKEGETSPTTDVVTPGMSVMYNKAVRAGDFVVAGAVPEEESKTVNLSFGYNYVANPYPVSIKIADISGDLSAHDSRPTLADQIMTLDKDSKQYVVYRLKESSGWTKDGEGHTTEDVIAPCQGFIFVKARNAGSLTFVRPSK